MKIVQLGANRGSDHVTTFVKAHQVDFLLLVEPHPVAIELLKECYADVPHIIENCAIVNDQTIDSVEFFYADDPNPNYEVSSLYKSHLQKHGTRDDKIISIQVPAITLNELFKKHNVTHLDYLFIDIEGAEEDIILSFDFNRYQIKNIQLERLHLKNENQLIEYLGRYGYLYSSSTGFDITFTKLGG